MSFFFNDTATTEIYTLTLHDALPICRPRSTGAPRGADVPGRRRWVGRGLSGIRPRAGATSNRGMRQRGRARSEEHTSELQSRQYLVCRLLLEKKHTLRHLTYTSSTLQ